MWQRPKGRPTRQCFWGFSLGGGADLARGCVECCELERGPSTPPFRSATLLTFPSVCFLFLFSIIAGLFLHFLQTAGGLS